MLLKLLSSVTTKCWLVRNHLEVVMFCVIDVMKYIIIVWWPDWDGNVRMTWTRGVECFNEIFGNNLFVICLLLKFDLQQSLAGDQWCWVSKTCAAQPGPATDWCKLVFKTDCSHSQYWLHCLHRPLQCHPGLHSIFSRQPFLAL